MNIDFDDACWSLDDSAWRAALIDLLGVLRKREQHAVVATAGVMLDWCREYVRDYESYYRTRLSAGRANALDVRVSPSGASAVGGALPWTLNAVAAASLVERPLRLVLENNQSDRAFLLATCPRLGTWEQDRWVEIAMGGGSAMKADIERTSVDHQARWRTFYLFDSDRLHPDELLQTWTGARDGCQGYAFEVACAALPSDRWHRLHRRSIENYLPKSVLDTVDAAMSAVLFGGAVVTSAFGDMSRHYNVKEGLRKDGVSPPSPDPMKQLRAARSQGFWLTLPAPDVAALEPGFGADVANKFNSIPPNYPWPPDVVQEVAAFAAALQDAM